MTFISRPQMTDEESFVLGMEVVRFNRVEFPLMERCFYGIHSLLEPSIERCLVCQEIYMKSAYTIDGCDCLLFYCVRLSKEVPLQDCLLLVKDLATDL